MTHLFLGHGETKKKTLDLFLVPQGDDVASLEAALAVRFKPPIARVRREGLVVAVHRKTTPRELDAWLREVHARAPLALVLRRGKVRGSDWHEASLRDPALLDVVARVVHGAPAYLSRDFGPKVGELEVSAALLASLSGRAPMPELLQDVFAALLAGNKAETRLVLADQLQERLPPLLGFDFDCDLVLRNVLAEVQQVSPASLAMPERFSRALAKRLGAHDADADADTADADTDDTDTDTDDTDDDNVAATNWGNVAAVRAAIAGKRWKALRLGLDENRAAHFKTLVALRPAELRAFAKSGYGPATRVANAGVFPLSRGDFKTALKLFDAAIEGPLDSGAAANPLFAVQDDNNHLGVDAARARRYLERCLPAGDRNPTVFLNGAFVCMELGEPDLALELLARAKKLGIKVKAHRNERLFVPLHARAEFKKLMR